MLFGLHGARERRARVEVRLSHTSCRGLSERGIESVNAACWRTKRVCVRAKPVSSAFPAFSASSPRPSPRRFHVHLHRSYLLHTSPIHLPLSPHHVSPRFGFWRRLRRSVQPTLSGAQAHRWRSQPPAGTSLSGVKGFQIADVLFFQDRVAGPSSSRVSHWIILGCRSVLTS